MKSLSLSTLHISSFSVLLVYCVVILVYDVHASILGQKARMWQFGGFVTGSYSFQNSFNFTATGSWANNNASTAITPTYLPSGGNPTGRVGGGAALLRNGNFMLFEERVTCFPITNWNDVWFSTNNGVTFTFVVQDHG